MHKDTLTHSSRRINEVVDLIGDLILSIEQDLVLLVQPTECQIGYSNMLPEILDLRSRTVYDVSHLVGHDELQVLCCKFISYKQSIFDFDCPHEVIFTIKVHILWLGDSNTPC